MAKKHEKRHIFFLFNPLNANTFKFFQIISKDSFEFFPIISYSFQFFQILSNSFKFLPNSFKKKKRRNLDGFETTHRKNREKRMVSRSITEKMELSNCSHYYKTQWKKPGTIVLKESEMYLKDLERNRCFYRFFRWGVS